ncbi:MAG: response regulator, partial [Holophagales bacterium]|nr:response regulator [Holophagales bacterium]
RFMLQITLLGLGARTDQAESGPLGLAAFLHEAAKGHSYDLVFLDCEMPFMNGFALVQKLRSMDLGREGDKPLRIVGITIDPDELAESRWREAGLDEVLGRPVDALTLESLLQRWFGLPQALPILGSGPLTAVLDSAEARIGAL